MSEKLLLTAEAVRVAGPPGKTWQVGRGSDANAGAAGAAGQCTAEELPPTEMPAEVPGETKAVA